MAPSLLVLNAGSSSLKFAVFDTALSLSSKGVIRSMRTAPRLDLTNTVGELSQIALPSGGMGEDDAVETILRTLDEQGLLQSVVAVGHRIVHGGPHFTAPVPLDDDALSKLRQLVPMAPLHQPVNLAIVDAVRERLADIPNVGCFDTAFHQTRPRLERIYALPRELSEDGLVSYGFHGLSYDHVASVLRERLGPSAGGRTIVCHLGSGASLCAMRAGRSVATSMGFSPLDGVPMGTRCGSLDPGLLLYLLRERGMTADDLQALLYERSGLLGVSGRSSDLETLLASDDPHADEAVDLFVHAVGRQIGSLTAVLGGLDTLVFTAGIGERSAVIRRRIAAGAAWIGVSINEAANEAHAEDISPVGARVRVLVLPTNEELVVARGMLALLSSS